MLYWDYYEYVKSHPITEWNVGTDILYGSNDNMQNEEIISDFTLNNILCDVVVYEGGEHYFHTEEQLNYYKNWLKFILTP